MVRGDDAVLDWLSITAVERILTEASVDLGSLVPVVDAAVEHPQQGEGPVAAHGGA
jgi:carbamate kinase